MDPTNNDENGKQGVGSFVVSPESSTETSGVNIAEETLDDRLAIMSHDSDDQSNNTDSSTPETLSQQNQLDDVPQPRQEEITNKEIFASENPNQTLQPTQVEENKEPEVYHTISGKPETFKETLQKTQTVSQSIPVAEEPKYFLKKDDDIVHQDKAPSLFAIILKFFFVVDCIVFVLSYKMSAIITFLFEGQYITKGENGLYSYGQMVIPKIVTDNALYVAIGLTVISLIALLIAGAIDLISRSTTRLSIKFLIFIAIAICIGWGVYVLSKNDFNIPLIINNILAS